MVEGIGHGQESIEEQTNINWRNWKRMETRIANGVFFNMEWQGRILYHIRQRRHTLGDEDQRWR